MPQIKIEIAGVSFAETVDLAKLLEEIEGIESTSVPKKASDHSLTPNAIGPVIIPEIKAAAEGHLIVLILAGKVFDGVTREVSKDIYTALKNLVLRRLGEWLKSKKPEQRERIVFVLDDEHMLVNLGDDKR